MSFLGNLQPDDYGWALDSEGIPEMWMWVGGIAPMGDGCDNGDWDTANSNKLVLLTCDPIDNKVKIKHDFGQIFPWDWSTEYSNLVWVSRNVFLLTSIIIDYDWQGGHPSSTAVVKSVVHACRLDENGSTDPDNWTITTDVWKREILKGGKYGEGSNFPTDKTIYPGVPSGMTVMPSMSRPARDWQENSVTEKNILTITGSWPYWGVVFGWNKHVVRVHRMSSIPEGILNGIRENNNTYYANDNAWTDGSDGDNTKVSAWQNVINYGNPDYYWCDNDLGEPCCGNEHNYHESKNDHEEGWCTCDSRGNFYYGNFVNWTGEDPLTFTEYNACLDYQHLGGIARINGENGLDTSSSRDKLMFNREGEQGDGWGGLGTPPGGWEDAGQNLDNPGIPYKISEAAAGFDHSHSLKPDGGACDIYGQSTGLLPTGSSWTAKDCLFLLRQPNQGKTHVETNFHRDGIWIVKEKTTGSKVMQVLKRYACFHQGSNGSPDSAINDGGGGGWSCIGLDHQTTHSCSTSGRALTLGMCFRPNSYK